MNDYRKRVLTTMANGEMKHDGNVVHRNKYNMPKNENGFLSVNKGAMGYKKDGHNNRSNHNNNINNNNNTNNNNNNNSNNNSNNSNNNNNSASSSNNNTNSNNMNLKYNNYGNKNFNSGPSQSMGTSTKFSRQMNKSMSSNNHNHGHNNSNLNQNHINNSNNDMGMFYSSKNAHGGKVGEYQYKKKMYHSKTNDSSNFQNLKKTINKEMNHQRGGGGSGGINVCGSGSGNGGGIGKMNVVSNNNNMNFGNSYRQNPLGYNSNNKGLVMHTGSGNNVNYSLGLFIENPQNTFVFDVEDLKQLFSHYNGAKHIRILNNRAAAQISFYDQNMIQQIKKDINGLTIDNVGTVRCIVLNDGKKIEQFLPFSSNDPTPAPAVVVKDPPNIENAIKMLKQITTVLNDSHRNRQTRGGNVMKRYEDAKIGGDLNRTNVGKYAYNTNLNKNVSVSYGEMKQHKTKNNNYMSFNENCDVGNTKMKKNNLRVIENDICYNNMQKGNMGNVPPNETGNICFSNARTHVPVNNRESKQMFEENEENEENIEKEIDGTNERREQNKVDASARVGKRLSRFELIDIFGYPGEFDVLSKIQGVNNANIKYISEQTNNRLILEIKGRADNDASVVDRMHISITAEEYSIYQKGIDLILKLLNSVFHEYCDLCMKKGVPLPTNLGFKRHEYIYNYDGSTKYMGIKEKGHISQDAYKTKYTPITIANANEDTVMSTNEGTVGDTTGDINTDIKVNNVTLQDDNVFNNMSLTNYPSVDSNILGDLKNT